MKPEQIEALRPRLDDFLGEFAPRFATRNTRAHFRTYVEGQLGPLERKSIEPIADAAGVSSRNLQEFLSLLTWDEDGVRDDTQRKVAREHSGPENLGILDETSFAKKGTETACVKRQYCGATGKVDNCVVSVHLVFASGEFHTLIDSVLYVPKEWAEDTKRRRKARIPDDVVYKPIHEIALDEIERARMNGVRLDWIGADERYGEVPDFLETLEGWGVNYVIEVPPGVTGWTCRPPTLEGSEKLAEDAEKPKPLAQVVEHGYAVRRAAATPYRVKDTLKGPEVWEVKEAPFFQHRRGRVSKKLRLLVARNVLDDERKFFLSAAPDSVPVETLLRVAFSRWRIERCFEDSKGEVGFDHFEVRGYRSIRRHFTLSMVSHLFLAEQVERLRGKKSGADGVSGQARGGHAPEQRRPAPGRAASAH